jgi:asparagine synthase (glutamine-hydrolysing)
MSGIAGIYRFDGGSVAADTVAAMTDAIDHQGPDGEWTWREGRVGLGHQRFETTPEAEHAGSPPERDGRVITFDGRIDNREELLGELDVAGPPGRVADADLVLAAHERWGEDCPERLIGAFAFAIRDPDEERVFAARDHVGLRPFYYYRGEDRLLFGSELKTLWAAGGVPRRLDELQVADLLSPGIDTVFPENDSNRHTFYEEVLRLPPAHSMVAESGAVELNKYWWLEPNRTIQFDSDERYAERFRELFEEAVRCRLRTVGPVGSTLSGGLDSSSNVSMACHLAEQDHYKGKIHTFSAVFDGERHPAGDESEYIEAVTEEMDVVPHCIRGDQRSPLEDIDEVLWHAEMPRIGNNFYLHWNLYREANTEDLRVLLDGLGGDTTLSHGTGRLPELLIKGRWIRFIKEVQRLSERFDHSMSTKGLLWGSAMALSPNAANSVWHRLVKGAFPERVNPAIEESFAKRVNLKKQINSELVSSPRRERDHHARLITGGVIPDQLERWNKTSMRFDIEPRYPFFDRRLMEYCFALPPDQKLKDGWTRLVLRRGLEGVLPNKIRYRGGKGNMSESFWAALRDYACDDVSNVIMKKDTHVSDFVNIKYVHGEFESFTDGESGGLYTLWYPVLLELWLSSHYPRNN